MRVETCYTYFRILYSELSAGVGYQLRNVDDTLLLHQVACLAKRYVGRHVDYSQKLVSQEHGILLGMCEMRIYFRMSVKMMSGKIECLFVERRRHGTVHFVFHRQLYCLYYRLEGGVATLYGHLALLERVHVDEVEVEDIHRTRFKQRLVYILHGMNAKSGALLSCHVFHHGGIARYYRVAFLVCLFQAEGLQDDFRTDTCRVAHRYSQYWFSVFHHFRCLNQFMLSAVISSFSSLPGIRIWSAPCRQAACGRTDLPRSQPRAR